MWRWAGGSRVKRDECPVVFQLSDWGSRWRSRSKVKADIVGTYRLTSHADSQPADSATPFCATVSHWLAVASLVVVHFDLLSPSWLYYPLISWSDFHTTLDNLD